MSRFKTSASIFALALLILNQSFATDWKSILSERLPVYGHRNWIIIADSAYPKQSAPGIETIHTGAGQIEVLQHVLKQIGAAPHVRPVVMLDAELEFVSEKTAPGVQTYRTELEALLANQPVREMPHEDIIRKLDEGAALFNILILKTDMTIPYTSVFIELDCGYWSAEKEKELRGLMQRQPRE